MLAFLLSPANAAETCSQEYCLTYETGRLAKSQDNVSIDLTSQAGIQPNETISAINWTGDYWLMSISNWAPGRSVPLGMKYASRLLKYDGEVFTDLSAEAELNRTRVHGARPKVVFDIRCFEGYCLLAYWIPVPGADGGLLKYDGGLKEVSAVGGELREMLWNGEYWLMWYVKGEHRPSNLEKFDGNKSVVVPLFELREWERYWIEDIHWDHTEKHWVISARVGWTGAWSPTGKPEMRQEKVIYDGEKVVPVSAVGREYPGKGICGPTGIIVLALFPLLYRRWASGGVR